MPLLGSLPLQKLFIRGNENFSCRFFAVAGLIIEAKNFCLCGDKMDRVILHVDLNSFYASVECLYHPDLRDKPVAVAGDEEQRHGIVLAKNEIAKGCGVQTGEALWEARKKCPGIVFVPPSYDRYLRYSRMAREIYADYTDQIEPFGLDECWLDLTGSTHLYGSGQQIADTIRSRIWSELGVTASVGVSYNKIFAKLGSDYQKPNATTLITPDNYRQIVWPLPVSDLLYVGPATFRKFHRLGISRIGDLAQMNPDLIRSLYGKVGLVLWSFANGLDASPVALQESVPPVKSIGNSTTAIHDLEKEADAKIVLRVLADNVAARLRTQQLEAQTVQISMRDTELAVCQRQRQLCRPSCLSDDLFNAAFFLYKAHNPQGHALRGITLRACRLLPMTGRQLSLYSDLAAYEKSLRLERATDGLRRRYGNKIIQRAVLLTDPALSGFDPGDHVIYPVSYFK